MADFGGKQRRKGGRQVEVSEADFRTASTITICVGQRSTTLTRSALYDLLADKTWTLLSLERSVLDIGCFFSFFAYQEVLSCNLSSQTSSFCWRFRYFATTRMYKHVLSQQVAVRCADNQLRIFPVTSLQASGSFSFTSQWFTNNVLSLQFLHSFWRDRATLTLTRLRTYCLNARRLDPLPPPSNGLKTGTPWFPATISESW